jgi:hypothetical protein
MMMGVTWVVGISVLLLGGCRGFLLLGMAWWCPAELRADDVAACCSVHVTFVSPTVCWSMTYSQVFNNISGGGGRRPRPPEPPLPFIEENKQ